MKIAVCCKFAPDTEDIKPAADGSVDASRAKWGVSDYDLQAIQAAADMTDGTEVEVVALTVGGAKIDQGKLTKELMSRGNLSALYRVVDDSAEEADTAVIASLLAELAVKSGADVVMCGEGSSDRYQRVVGSQVAAVLGWPCVTCVDKISLEGDKIVVERDLEDGIEVVELAAPCVIATTSTINTPPIPNMKAVLAAGKKPVETFQMADLDAPAAVVEVLSSAIPEQPGRQKIILAGSPEQIAAQLVEKLTIDKVL